MAVLITEGTKTLAGTLEKTGPKRFRIKIIDEGVGSSGTYPAETLELAAKEGVFGKGVHMYLDHPTALESMDRPERTVKDLAAVLDDSAVYEESALYAPIKAFSAYADTIEEMKDDIGVSIRATAEIEEANGERVVTRIVEVLSVDFVTKAGRGGKIMEVLESARRKEVREATASDIENWLERAVQAAHGNNGRGGYVYVRDHDAEYVYYRAESGIDGKRTLYREGYTLGDGDVTLAGDPIEVNAETVYKPVAPASPTSATEAAKDSPPVPAGVTENQEEATMATIDDKELATLRESAGRATVAESELTTATERATTAEAALQESNDSAAANLVTAALAEAGITAPKTAARLSKGYPVKENGALDSAKFGEEVAEAIAELAESNGAGRVRGLGHTAVESKTVTDDDIVNAL